MKVVIVLPAYNEEKHIVSVINDIKRVLKKINYKIIVVDDYSIDQTALVAKEAGASVISYKVNKGVGYATSLGLKKAIKMKPDIIIFLDADGQHDPKYIPEFIEAIKNGADYVAGWRDLSNYPLNRKIGNWGLKILTNLLCPTGIKDTECGFRALSLETAKKIKLKSKRYEREVDFAYEVWRNKFKIALIKINVPKFYPKFAIIRGFKNFKYLIKRRFNI